MYFKCVNIDVLDTLYALTISPIYLDKHPTDAFLYREMVKRMEEILPWPISNIQ